MASARFPAVFNSSKALVALAEKIHVFVETTCSSLWDRYFNSNKYLFSIIGVGDIEISIHS